MTPTGSGDSAPRYGSRMPRGLPGGTVTFLCTAIDPSRPLHPKLADAVAGFLAENLGGK